jgi:regulator of RNase E activity RraA
MKQPRVLIQTEEEQEFRNFDFVYSDANGIYIIDSETMCVVLNGTDFILEYNNELYEEIKKNIAIKNLMNKN